MKKLLIIIIILFNQNLSSQVSFPDAKQYFKEFLAIQTLLAENRVDDLQLFLIKYGYKSINSEDDILYSKINFDENEIVPLVYIKSDAKYLDSNLSDNYLEIIFIKYISGNPTIEHSYEDAMYLKNIIQNLYEVGLSYSVISSFEEVQKKNPDLLEKVDRYTYKSYSKNDPNKITYLKASNFTKSVNSKENILFFGPGSILGTEVLYFDPIELSPDKYMFKIDFRSYLLSKKNASREKFNVDFFMSLKNFNDRIWRDN